MLYPPIRHFLSLLLLVLLLSSDMPAKSVRIV